MFDRMRKVPEAGSLMERLMILVFMMRQEIEFQKARAQLQALMSQEGAEEKTIQEAFKKLHEAFYPFNKNAKASKEKELKDVLMREVARGPLSFTPLMDLHAPKIASKLARGQARLAQRAAMLQSGKMETLDPRSLASRRLMGRVF